MGVSNANMGISNKNMGSPLKIWGSPTRIWGSPARRPWGSPIVLFPLKGNPINSELLRKAKKICFSQIGQKVTIKHPTNRKQTQQTNRDGFLYIYRYTILYHKR